MANLKDNNYHKLRMRVNKDEYWDFFIAHDDFGSFTYNSDNMYDKCLISYIDASLPECVGRDNWLYGAYQYQWESANTITHTMYNIGYTGVDNGLIQYRRDRISNKEFIDIYTKSKYLIEEGDNRLKLHAVSGTTMLYDYPLHIEDGVIKFNGGFYQGFFKTECEKYYILPSKIGKDECWELEFQLNKCELEKESNKTLNDKYPSNKGIFFYIGTRAENKWVYLYDSDDAEKRDECFTLADDNYIEDAEIDKNDYIIGNFFNVDPDFEYEELDIDNYTNFYYYDDALYTPSEEELFSDDLLCNDKSLLDDYIDIGYTPRTVDETMPHDVLECFCCNNDSSGGKGETTQVAFFNACGCLKFKNVKKINTDKCKGEVTPGDIFGDNEYIDDFDGLTDPDTDYFENEVNLSDFEFDTDNGFNIYDANMYYFNTDNKFLLFDRTKDGYTINNWVEGTQMMYFGQKNKFKGNLFILMNRTKTGYTVNNIDELRDKANNRYDDTYNDIYNNAFALRITDNGELGYRYLVLNCEAENENKYEIMEGYSFPNVISDCEWHTVHLRIKEVLGKIKLYFYVDGKIVYITKALPMFNFHKLNDLNEKQEGVPYNISIGGGTQGLAETVLPNYMLDPYRTYPIEENFAGSFIGYMKSFKFYNCKMEFANIVSNYNWEKRKQN